LSFVLGNGTFGFLGEMLSDHDAVNAWHHAIAKPHRSTRPAPLGIVAGVRLD
jgi:hypothetical protein